MSPYANGDTDGVTDEVNETVGVTDGVPVREGVTDGVSVREGVAEGNGVLDSEDDADNVLDCVGTALIVPVADDEGVTVRDTDGVGVLALVSVGVPDDVGVCVLVAVMELDSEIVPVTDRVGDTVTDAVSVVVVL